MPAYSMSRVAVAVETATLLVAADPDLDRDVQVQGVQFLGLSDDIDDTSGVTVTGEWFLLPADEELWGWNSFATNVMVTVTKARGI